ncbi:hypothetical protein Tco_0952557 [Tanacetum coccineum]|uniref:Uncharacterized protein n=1 Tax=Tanacetum coccineum TaxID=301880 RepID=A0ABQ5DXC1_9ASTR
MALPPRDQRHRYLRCEGLQYTYADIADFEMRLARIYRREVHRVQVFDFGGLPDLMVEGLSAKMLMEHRDAQGVSLFTSRAWRGLFDVRGLLTVGFGAYWAKSVIQIPNNRDLRDYWIGISYAGDFLGTAPSYTAIRDLILRLCHRLITFSIAGRSQAPEKFVARLAKHFGLLVEERLRGLIVIAPELLIIDMAELVTIQIYMEIDDTWAWVALGPERQPDAAAGGIEDALVVDEGDQAVFAPVQAPQQPPPPPPAAEIDDRSGEILHMDDFMYDTANGGYRADIPGIRWDFLRELTCSILETYQAED